MEQKRLEEYIVHKYGLHFTREPGGQLVLRLRDGESAFAIFDPQRGLLAVKCPDFAGVINSLPQFQTPELTRRPDWVELRLAGASQSDVADILDYGFKAASNGNQQFVAQQLTFLPAEKVEEQYHAQKILPREGQPRKGRRLDQQKAKAQPSVPKPLAKMMAAYDYTVMPADARAYNFYRQGQMVEDYTDDYDQLDELQHYYPDYHCMNVHQLRTYFTWRTHLRHGHFTVTSTSYSYVYLYELLNNLGVKNPHDGFIKLQTFLTKYAPSYHQRMTDYLHQWLKDYVLYYGLDRAAANQTFQSEIDSDRDYHVLLHPTDYPATKLSQLFANLSSYAKRCKLAQSAPAEWAQLVNCVWQRLLKADQDYFGQMVAAKRTTSHYFFANAVFYYRNPPRGKQYVVDSERVYLCDGRKYECQHWLPLKEQGRRLNLLFHEIDRLTRQRLHLGHPLKPRSEDGQLLALIQAGIADYQRAREEAARPKVEINLGELGQIRADASVTRESLLTDAEKDDEQPTSGPEKLINGGSNPTLAAGNDESNVDDELGVADDKSSPDNAEGLADHDQEKAALSEPADQNSPMPSQAPDQEDDDEAPALSADERYLLVALLKGQPYSAYLKQHHLMASLLVDSINDKLMDLFGDTVIDFDPDGKPTVIEDYADDCKELYLPKEDQ